MLNKFEVSDDYFGVWIDNIHNLIISVKVLWKPKLNTYWSIITYFDYQGHIIYKHCVEFGIGDLIVNPKNGDLIFDNYIIMEPAEYIYIPNISGIITKINTTRQYAASGLALDRQQNIIAAEYGLDIYFYNGTFIKHIDPSNHTSIDSPQVYDGYIAYFDLFTDHYKPFIEFIDYDGQKILTLPYSDEPVSGIHDYFYIDRHGNIIASIGDQIKIWHQL